MLPGRESPPRPAAGHFTSVHDRVASPSAPTLASAWLTCAGNVLRGEAVPRFQAQPLRVDPACVRPLADACKRHDHARPSCALRGGGIRVKYRSMVKLPPSQSLLHAQVEEVRDQAACLLGERAQLAPLHEVICAAGCSLVRAPPYLGGPMGLASSGCIFYWAPRMAGLACGGRIYPGPRAWSWRSLRRPAAQARPRHRRRPRSAWPRPGCRRRPGAQRAHAIGAERVARGGDGSQRLPCAAQGAQRPRRLARNAEREAAIRLAAGAWARSARAIGIGAEREARRWQSRRAVPTARCEHSGATT